MPYFKFYKTFYIKYNYGKENLENVNREKIHDTTSLSNYHYYTEFPSSFFFHSYFYKTLIIVYK